MKITAHITTCPACINYLQIIKDGAVYTLEEFVKSFSNGPWEVEKILSTCSLRYRGETLTIEEYGKQRRTFYDSLLFHERYNTEIYPLEDRILITSHDYYKAAKFLNRAEKCLQTARYYLGCCWDKFENNEELNWSTGYGPMFYIRTLNFSTAAVWYNNCCDYMLLVVYFAFGLYAEIDDYTPNLTHEQLLKSCTYAQLCRIYSMHKSNTNFKTLWKIISACYSSLSETNKWANYIKHKGGIDFDGLVAPNLYQLIIKDTDGNTIIQNENFESIKIDLDVGIKELVKAHQALYDCYNKLMDFINFAAAAAEITENGISVPPRASYMKDILTI